MSVLSTCLKRSLANRPAWNGSRISRRPPPPANTLLPTQKKNNPGTLGCPAFVRFLWPLLRHSTGKIYKIADAVSQGKSLARAEKRRKMNIIHRMGGVFTTADSRLLGWLVQRTLLVGNLRIQHGTPLGRIDKALNVQERFGESPYHCLA